MFTWLNIIIKLFYLSINSFLFYCYVYVSKPYLIYLGDQWINKLRMLTLKNSFSYFFLIFWPGFERQFIPIWRRKVIVLFIFNSENREIGNHFKLNEIVLLKISRKKSPCRFFFFFKVCKEYFPSNDRLIARIKHLFWEKKVSLPF